MAKHKHNARSKARMSVLMNNIKVAPEHKDAVLAFCCEHKGETDEETFRLNAIEQDWFPADKRDEYLDNVPNKADGSSGKSSVSKEQIARITNAAKAKPKAETTGEPAPKAETVETEGGSEPNEPVTEGGATRTDNLPEPQPMELGDEPFKPVVENVELANAGLFAAGREYLAIERTVSGKLNAKVAELAASLIYFRTMGGIDASSGEVLEVVKDKTLPDFKDFRARVEYEMFRIEKISDIDARNALVGRVKSATISRNLTSGVKAGYLMAGTSKPKANGHIRTPKFGVYMFRDAYTPPVTREWMEQNPDIPVYPAIGAAWWAFEPELEVKGGKTIPNTSATRIDAMKARGEEPTGLEDILQMPDWAVAAQYDYYFNDKKLTARGRVLKGTQASQDKGAVKQAKVVQEMKPGEIVNAGFAKVGGQLSSDEYKPTTPQLWLIFQAALNACHGESGKVLDDIVARIAEGKKVSDDEKAVHVTMCMLREALGGMVGEAEATAEDIEAANKAMADAA